MWHNMFGFIMIAVHTELCLTLLVYLRIPSQFHGLCSFECENDCE
jgi:hypothetical protein